MAHQVRIAIIGAGLSGLSIARHLAPMAEVEVFEKSRGFGGRMSTRRAETFAFDHGAQYFTARGAAFAAFLDPFIAQGRVAQWTPRLTALGERAEAPVWTEPRHVAVPGMNALAKTMAEGHAVHLATRIADLRREAKGWTLSTTDAVEHGPFDWVISTAPAEQTATLFPADFRETETLRRTGMQGCYSLMLGFSELPDLGWDAAVVGNRALAWIAMNHSKPGRGAAPSMICQTGNLWAEEHLEDDQTVVRDRLLEEVAQVTGVSTSGAEYVNLHRWRFAAVETPADRPYLLDPQLKLAAAGDWCGAGRVEAGFESALALSAKLEAEMS